MTPNFKRARRLPLETMFDGAPIAETLPSWVQSADAAAELAFWCGAELQAWREAIRTHKRLPTANTKLDFRRSLEAAFEALRAAGTNHAHYH